MVLKRSPSQRHVLFEAGERGLTWREYSELTGTHHGSASGALSKMNSRGQAVRLVERRGDNAIYVHKDFVGDRPTIARIPRTVPPDKGMSTAETMAMLAYVDALANLKRVVAVIDLELRHAAELDELVGAFEEEKVARVTHWREFVEEMRTDFTKEREQLEVELTTLRDKNAEDRKLYSARASEGVKMAQREAAKKTAAAVAKARDEGEAIGWQTGYDDALKQAAHDPAADPDSDLFIEGRALGRREGEALVTRRVAAVATEIHRTIVESTPIRTHFNGCYKIHPECSVRSVARSVGFDVKGNRGSFPRAV